MGSGAVGDRFLHGRGYDVVALALEWLPVVPA